jgi:hypothetical protein
MLLLNYKFKALCLLISVEYHRSGLFPAIYLPADFRTSSCAEDRPYILSLWSVLHLGSGHGMLAGLFPVSLSGVKNRTSF